MLDGIPNSRCIGDAPPSCIKEQAGGSGPPAPAISLTDVRRFGFDVEENKAAPAVKSTCRKLECLLRAISNSKADK